MQIFHTGITLLPIPLQISTCPKTTPMNGWGLPVYVTSPIHSECIYSGGTRAPERAIELNFGNWELSMCLGGSQAWGSTLTVSLQLVKTIPFPVSLFKLAPLLQLTYLPVLGSPEKIKELTSFQPWQSSFPHVKPGKILRIRSIQISSPSMSWICIGYHFYSKDDEHFLFNDIQIGKGKLQVAHEVITAVPYIHKLE